MPLAKQLSGNRVIIFLQILFKNCKTKGKSKGVTGNQCSTFRMGQKRWRGRGSE